MIYDCFSFFNELDLLEIRLNTLDKAVDRFVLSEAPLTHTGLPKPLYYAENKERFARFNDRIIHVVVDDFPPMPAGMPAREKAWTRENWQRNAIVRGIAPNAKDDDVLIISDLDEIPAPEYLKAAAAAKTGVARLDLKAYGFFLNLRNLSYPVWHSGPKVLTWRTFRDPAVYQGAKFTECCVAAVNQGPTATRVRFLEPTETLKAAGWHFSYLGGVEAVRRKMKSIAHTEFDTGRRTSAECIQNAIANGKSPFNNFERSRPELLDDSFPQYILSNRGRFAHLIAPTPSGRNPSRLYSCAMRLIAISHDALFRTIAALTPRFMVPVRHKIYSWLSGRA